MFHKLKLFFFGEIETYPIEKKIHILLTFFMFIVLVIGSVANVATGMNFWATLLTFLAVVLVGIVYYLSRFTGIYQLTRLPLVILSLLMVAIIWFYNAGYDGNIINLLFVLFVGLYIVAPPGFRFWVFVSYLALLTSLVLAQHFHPEWVYQYDTAEQRFVDIFIGNILYLTILFAIIRTVIKNYYLENQRVIAANEELVKKNVVISENYEKLKKAELDLIAAKEKAEESDKLKTSFLANMSHEIRTPMNGIMGFAHLLRNQNLSGDKQLHYVDIIERSGKRMLSIINDLVDISKIESGIMSLSFSEVNLNDMLQYIHGFFKDEVEARGMKFHLFSQVNESSAQVTTDKEKVYAILMNLVKNSIKYTEHGSIEIGCHILDDAIYFSVKDTGIGIPQEKQAQIFNRFIQVHAENSGVSYEGAGLGLAITKAYVEMLQGAITVDSMPGKGSEFVVMIPYSPIHKEVSSKQTGPLKSSGEFRKLKILIAEDEESSGYLLSEIIQLWAGEVIMTRNGQEAVSICKEQGDIDLVLMDIKMPVLDGLSAIREIREFNTTVVIMAQTAYALTGDREKVMDAGANEYLSKPIDAEFLETLLRKYFA